VTVTDQVADQFNSPANVVDQNRIDFQVEHTPVNGHDGHVGFDEFLAGDINLMGREITTPATRSARIKSRYKASLVASSSEYTETRRSPCW